MTASLTLYGIPNCNTVKTTRAWLTDHAVHVVFHDFKKQGVPADLLQGWIAAVGWELLVNRKGSTWRTLDDKTRSGVVDAASACVLMQSHPSVIKRPVVRWPDGQITVGFDVTQWLDFCHSRDVLCADAASETLTLEPHTLRFLKSAPSYGLSHAQVEHPPFRARLKWPS